MKLKRIIERWSDIKKLVEADEYFLGAAFHYNASKVIRYEYFKNTKRNTFWKFINDYIKTNSED